MPIAKLTIDLEARLATLEANLKGAVDASGRAAQQIEQRFAAAGAALRGALGAVGVGLSAALFAGTIKSAIDAVDALNDVADATGTTVENAGALEDIALRTGTSLDVATGALIKLNQGLADTKPDSDTARALRQIGLDAADLRKIDPAEALLKIAQAQARFADDGDKARLMQVLFGRSLREVAPLLKDLAEQGQLNAKITSDQAAEAERFNRALGDFQKSGQDFGRTMTMAVLPAINQAITDLAAARKAFGGFFSGIMAFNPLTGGPANAVTGLQQYSAELQQIEARIAKIDAHQAAGGSMGPFRDNELADLKRRADTARQYIAYYRDVLKLTDGSAGGGRGVTGTSERASVGPLDEPAKPAKPTGAGAVKDTISEYERYVQRLQASILQLNDATAVETVLYDTLGNKLGDLKPAQLDYLIRLAQQKDALIAASEAERAIAKAAEEAAATQQRLRSEAEGLWSAVQTPVERYAAELERIAYLTQHGAFGDAGTAEAQDKIARITEAARKRFASATQAAGAELSEYAKEAQRNIQDALGDTLLSAVKGDFDSIGQMWLDLMQRMAAQALAAQLNDKLFGTGASGGAGGAAGWISAIGAFFGGGTTSTTGATDGMGGNYDEMLGVVGGRATGGPVDAGKAYWVGEQGPEIVRFGAAGAVLNSRDAMRAAAAPGISITQHLAVGEFVTPSQAAQLARQARDAAVAATLDTLRRSSARV